MKRKSWITLKSSKERILFEAYPAKIFQKIAEAEKMKESFIFDGRTVVRIDDNDILVVEESK